jgi:branched-chain amino acid transport system substrate-binding protein
MGAYRRTVGFAILLVGLLLAGCSNEIQIGAVVSKTGVADVYGERVQNGLDLALEEINAAGGVAGKTLTLVYRDDESDPKIGTMVTEDLIEEVGVRTIIGAVTSPVTLEIAPICEKRRVVLLSPTSSAPEITEAGTYIFRNYPSDILEGTTIADFARDLGLAKVAIFAVNNEFGAGLKKVFTQKYENRFREVVGTFDFFETDTAAYPAMVEEVKALQPEGIYLIGYVNEVAQFLRLLKDADVDAVMLSTGSITEDVISLAGDASEYLVYPQPPFDVESTEPVVKGFVDAYRAKYGETPDTFAAHSYDALKILARAIEAGGGSMIADDVRAGLSSITRYQGASGVAGFDNNGDVVEYPRLFIIHNGQAKPYEKFLEEGGSLQMSGS